MVKTTTLVAVYVIDRPVISVQLYGRNYYQPEQYVSKSCHGSTLTTPRCCLRRLKPSS